MSEVITHVSPADREQTHPYGTEMEWKLDDYKDAKVLVIQIRVAKRKRKNIMKAIGLPCDPKFEPWTLPLLKRIKRHNTLSYGLTRQRVWQIVKKRLGLAFPDVKTHSLRHFRLTHLVDFYGLDPYELIIYAGWTYAGAFGSSGMLDTYLHLDWRKYFPKLLKNVA